MKMNNERNISQTAMLIASLRALACYEEDPCIQGKDHMAELFLPDEKRIPLSTPEIRSAIKKAIPEGLYEYVIARTKYFDELYLHYLNLQFPQIVLLGAGYDSRAYRFESNNKSTTIYEADAPATQEDKRQILKVNGTEIHNNVIYTAIDFEKDNLFEKLCAAGFQKSLKTLYIWEGVTFYLEPKSVDKMLFEIKENSAAGSILSFDYQHIDIDNDLINTGLKDETVKFGMKSDEIETYLIGMGYSVLEKVDSEKMCNRYLTLSDGQRFGNVKSIMNIITASVAK